MTTARTCHWHPDRETGLSCGRCGKPICVECMRQHPVGVRCKECSRPSPMPTHQVSASYLVRGLAAMAGLGLAGAIVLSIMARLPGAGFLGLLVMLGVGFAAGEGIGAAVNRRRGRPYQVMAAGAVLLALGLFTLAELAQYGVLVVNVFTILGAVIALVVAVSRLQP